MKLENISIYKTFLQFYVEATVIRTWVFVPVKCF